MHPRLIRPFALLVMLVGLLIGAQTAGCASWFEAAQDACDKAMPTMQQIDLRIDNVQTAVAQAQVLVDSIPDASKRAMAQGLLDNVLAKLRQVQDLEKDIISACQAPDLIALFKDVVKAWEDFSPVLALFGGTAESRVPAPMIVVEAHGR